jgi:hypothetical protein
MTHYATTVVVKDPDDLEDALAPFDENGEWFRGGSRWDWWIIGGRFTGQLANRQGEQGDVFRKSDIDWDTVGDIVIHELRDIFRGGGSLFAGEYAIRDGEDEDAYVRRLATPFKTHAFLGLDGEWHENGQMGWFGVKMDDEERDVWPQEYQRLLAEVSDDAFVCIVDCHV